MFITLPNEESIRSDVIFAVRIGKAKEATTYCSEMKPRIIIDYGVNNTPGILQSYTNTIVCEFESHEAVLACKAEIMAKLQPDDTHTCTTCSNSHKAMNEPPCSDGCWGTARHANWTPEQTGSTPEGTE